MSRVQGGLDPSMPYWLDCPCDWEWLASMGKAGGDTLAEGHGHCEHQGTVPAPWWSIVFLAPPGLEVALHLPKDGLHRKPHHNLEVEMPVAWRAGADRKRRSLCLGGGLMTVSYWTVSAEARELASSGPWEGTVPAFHGFV